MRCILCPHLSVSAVKQLNLEGGILRWLSLGYFCVFDLVLVLLLVLVPF